MIEDDDVVGSVVGLIHGCCCFYTTFLGGVCNGFVTARLLMRCSTFDEDRQ